MILSDTRRALLLAVVAVLVLGCGVRSPTLSPTVSPTAPATSTPTAAATETSAPTSTHTPIPTSTHTPTPFVSPVAPEVIRMTVRDGARPVGASEPSTDLRFVPDSDKQFSEAKLSIRRPVIRLTFSQAMDRESVNAALEVVPSLPLTRDRQLIEALRRSLAVYRLVFGQPRQDDLVDYLLQHVPRDRLDQLIERLRINLSPK